MDSKVSTKKRKAPKPGGRDNPLWLHPSNRWCKKIRGKFHYFGPKDDLEGALAKWENDKDDLLGGVPAPVVRGKLTVNDLCNEFLTAKRRKVNSRALSERSHRDYYHTCRRIVDFFGGKTLVKNLRAKDFGRLREDIAKKRNATALGNEIIRVRSIFKFGYTNELMRRPINFGSEFGLPTKKQHRIEKAKRKSKHGKRMFQPAELRLIVKALEGKQVTMSAVDDESGKPVKVKLKPNPVMLAMVLCGANAAYGQTDCSNLEAGAIDFQSGWADYPRVKTGVERRCKLWPETVKALRAAIKVRPNARNPEDEGCIFLTKYGRRFVRESENEEAGKRGASIDGISQEFGKLMKKLNLNGSRGFYCLRRGFQTFANHAVDKEATSYIMGHVDESMGATYSQDFPDERLVKVVDEVHRRVFGK